MSQRWLLLALVAIAPSVWAQASLHDALDQAQQRLRAQDATQTLTVIVESDQPEATNAAFAREHATVRHRVDRRWEVQLTPVALERLAAALPAGTFIRAPYPHAAHVTSQGVAVTGAADMHALNARGAGVKIGIIDLGFASFSTAQAAGELPTNAMVTVTDYTGTGATTGTNHGTNVAQIVYDMAPQAQLYLAKISTDVQLQQAVNAMVAAGVKVINHSVGWYGAAFYDGTGPLCNTVNSADANGIQWVNSAGNDRLRHYLATFTDADGDKRHEFATGQEYNTITLTVSTALQLVLNWDDYPSTNIDYNLYLYNGNPDTGGVVVASSATRQSGYQNPYESLSYTAAPGTYYVVVTKSTTTTAHVRLSLFSLGANLTTRTTASSLAQPADCANTLTVGATNLSDAPESFSSEGPTTDGRPKPELSGPDGVVTSLSSGFYGTSAAAPHVAGAVALLTGKLAVPPQQAAVSLLSMLDEVNGTGFDYRTGNGRISLDADGDGKIHDLDNCDLVANADQADLDGDGLGNVCDDDADGDGLSAAQEAAAGSNPLKPDTDGDGLNDYDEVIVHGTSPVRADTDGDGVSDYEEIFVYGTDPLSSSLQGDLAPAGAPDGAINVADLLRLMRFIGGHEQPTAQELTRADMNSDGLLDVRDMLVLSRLLGY